jgi:hypothetical protein
LPEQARRLEKKLENSKKKHIEHEREEVIEDA